MSNRITDQQTQNALIAKFKLEGLLAEMSVANIVLPVVNVANLESSLTVGEFEKWRSVFSSSLPYIDPANITNFNSPSIAGVTKVADTTAMVSNPGLIQTNANCGVRLPSGAVGVPATDGTYRLVVTVDSQNAFRGRIKIQLVDQAAFGDPVALGTIRSLFGSGQWTETSDNNNICFDFLFAVRTTLIANAIVISTAAVATTGTGQVCIICTKLIDEIPPSPLFP